MWIIIRNEKDYEKIHLLGLETQSVSLQKQPPEVFYKKGAVNNFPKFTGKHLDQDLQLHFKKGSGQAFSC